jgi:hypothetical protein
MQYHRLRQSPSTSHSFPSLTVRLIRRHATPPDLMIPTDYEKRIRSAFLQVVILCLCAVFVPLFSLTGILTPEDEPLGQWFQRAGIVMTVLAVLAHFKAAGIASTMIAGASFADTWEAYHKYARLQTLAAWLSLILIVIGAVIWSYGDLIFPEPQEEQEQNAIVWSAPETVRWGSGRTWVRSHHCDHRRGG